MSLSNFCFQCSKNEIKQKFSLLFDELRWAQVSRSARSEPMISWSIGQCSTTWATIDTWWSQDLHVGKLECSGVAEEGPGSDEDWGPGVTASAEAEAGYEPRTSGPP